MITQPLGPGLLGEHYHASGYSIPDETAFDTVRTAAWSTG